MTHSIPSDLLLRRPTQEDALAVLELQRACDIAAYGKPDSDLEDLVQKWSNLDLAKDGWLLMSADGQAAGYGSVLSETDGYFLDIYAHPALSRQEIYAFLLARCQQRVAELLAAAPHPAPATVSTIIAAPQVAERQALEAAGYTPSKYYFRMQVDLDELPHQPVWPVGCELRTMVPGQDDEGVYEFIARAFDWPGRAAPVSFQRWREFMMRPDHFRPDLWFLLVHGQELIGAAICFDYGYGWVRHLGVAPAWRRQGLGSRLLQHVFRTFYQRGQAKVALGVEANNIDAVVFYERAGMRQVQQHVRYARVLSCLQNS